MAAWSNGAWENSVEVLPEMVGLSVDGDSTISLWFSMVGEKNSQQSSTISNINHQRQSNATAVLIFIICNGCETTQWKTQGRQLRYGKPVAARLTWHLTCPIMAWAATTTAPGEG